MPEPAATVASAFVAGVRSDGLEPDPALRILRHARAVAAPAVRGPGALGSLHERLMSDHDRTRRGAWYTPDWLARALVRHALPDRASAARGTVLDPACGGGVFLLAAAQRMCELGVPPAEAVRALRGRDLDPVAVAATEAALWWWSARRGVPVVAGARLDVDDALTGRAWGVHGAVVGNPPFLGQLRRATATDRDRRAALRDRYGPVVRAYTDPSWLFLVAGVDAVVTGGRVVMVQPQSLVAARDAGAVRAFVDERALLVHSVVDDGSAFDAAVAVCAPVLERRDATERGGDHNDWVEALSDVRGTPRVTLPGAPTLGDVAEIHAGFRDEYYGLVDAVSEGGTGRPLVTAGAIDPFRVLDRPQRFAGQRWLAPRVDPDLVRGRAARWLELQAGPKVLVATQTRVLEAVADPSGELVGSVPVVCVRPHDPDLLWRVLAVLQAPAVSAWLLRRSAGTALSVDACKPTTALLSRVPLPHDPAGWDTAALEARALSEGAGDHERFAVAADAAYGLCDEAVRRWWCERRPVR